MLSTIPTNVKISTNPDADAECHCKDTQRQRPAPTCPAPGSPATLALEATKPLLTQACCFTTESLGHGFCLALMGLAEKSGFGWREGIGPLRVYISNTDRNSTREQ